MRRVNLKCALTTVPLVHTHEHTLQHKHTLYYRKQPVCLFITFDLQAELHKEQSWFFC